MVLRWLPVTWVEVFAETPMSGNLLPVLHDADDVPDAVLGLAARRFLQAETSFVQSASAEGAAAGATYRHRIFTVATELPFAGHPSLGTAAAQAHRLGLAHASFVQETRSGLQQVSVATADGAVRVTLRQNDAVLSPPVDAGAVLAALGAGPAHPSLPSRVVSTGLPALILPVAEVEALAAVRFDAATLRAALAPFDDRETLTCYLVAEESPGRWRARSFGLDLTGGEDPATGSAAGPLGAYLREHRDLDRLVVDQGVEMGCPSRLTVDCTDGVVVSGVTRIVGEGRFALASATP